MATASVLAKSLGQKVSTNIIPYVQQICDEKLRMLLYEHGVGYHRAGISWEDRRIVEQMFIAGILHVLTCTSTLSLGVNLPVHLVVIKGTQQFLRGQYREYDESTILQMAGRAGRVQFGDKEATVAIMTN